MMPNDQKELARRRALAALAQIPGVTDVMEEAGSAQPAPDADTAATLAKLRAARGAMETSSTASPVGSADGLPMPDYRPLGGPRDANPAVTSAVEGVESGKPGAPEEAAFERAISAASKRRATAGYWRAVESLQAGLSNRAADRSYSEALLGEADSPVREYLQRKAMRAEQAKLQREAAMRDPNSPESIRLRALLRATGADMPPEVLDQLAAENESAAFQAAGIRLQGRAREDAAVAGERERVAALKEQRRREAIAEERRLADRTWQAGQRALDRNSREKAAAITAGDRQEKAARELAEKQVGGFSFDPANPPSADAAKKMAAAAIARDEIMGSLTRLESLFDKHGTEAGGGAVQSEMESEAMNITNKLRVLNDMGVPNGADYEMLARQIPNITGAGAMATRNSSIKPKFESLRKQVGRTVDATARAFKYNPERAPAQGRAAPSSTGPDVDLTQPAAPQERKQYSRSRDQTRVVDAHGNVLRIEEGDTRGR